MAGLNTETPIPLEIKMHRESKILELTYDKGEQFKLTFEFLRVFSPSAEVRGHGIGQETLQIGKRDIDILRIDPVGNYAIKPVFSDGHESGLYSWDLLHALCVNCAELWQAYLEKLEEAGASRDPGQCPSAPSRPASTCGKKS